MDLDAFFDLVTGALESLPDEFKHHMENVYVDVEEWPTQEDLLAAGLDPRDRRALLGLYHGVPLTHRNTAYASPPDRITIYQKPIEAMVGPDPEAICAQVRHTVIHEIAHYYGIDDDRLEELGAY